MKRATNNMEVRKANRNRVFQYVNRFERISRQEIAGALQMSVPTVQQMIGELEELGVVVEKGEFQSTGGRKAKAVGPSWDAVYAIGLDITRNHISLVLTNLSQQVLAHERFYKPFEASQNYYKDIALELARFIEDNEVDQERILGVGISIPGIVDGDKNRISYSHVLKVHDVACEEIARYIPYPCALLNEANAAAATEMRNGKSEDFVYLSLSNSVGGAVFLKDIYTGDNWRSGEFGHMMLDKEGPKCYCGKKGCLDVYCSALRLSQMADGKLEQFFKNLESGDSRSRKAFQTYIEYLSIAIDNLRMIFDCDIILGGYVGAFMGEYLQEIRELVKANSIFEDNAEYVKVCKYKVESSALGAAQFYIKNYLKSI